MLEKRYVIPIILGFIILHSLLIGSQINEAGLTKSLNNHFFIGDTAQENDYIVKDPIIIDNPTDFLDYGFNGSGTIEEPYIIENINITSNLVPLIQIRNIFDVHFVINQCWLNGLTNNFPGILFENVSYGSIIDCDILSCDVGVYVNDVYELRLENNYIINNIVGITILNAKHSMFTGNNVTKNFSSGIILKNSNENLINENTITDNGDFDYIGNSDLNGKNIQNKIASTLSESQGDGIYADPSLNNEIHSNYISGNVGDGIHVYQSNSTLIHANNVASNGLTGIFNQDSHYTVISENNISWSGTRKDFMLFYNDISQKTYSESQGDGIYADPSTNLKIINNRLHNNLKNGINSLKCQELIISGNKIKQNHFNGLKLVNTNYTDVISNEIVENGFDIAQTENNNNIDKKTYSESQGDGIYADPSHHLFIEGNLIKQNVEHGIEFVAITTSTVTNNIILANQKYGILCSNRTEQIEVASNDFISNNIVAGTSQARDDGINNIFNQNFWSDYDKTLEYYEIDGFAENKDVEPVLRPHSYEGPLLDEPTIIFPNGGEWFNTSVIRNIEISWQPVGEEIFYDLYYSHDSGSHWILIETSLTKTSYSWEISSLKSSDEYLIKVIAKSPNGILSVDISDDTFKITTTDDDISISSFESLTVLFGLVITYIVFKRKQRYQ